MEGPGPRCSRDLLVRRLSPGQLLCAAIGAFVQPAVRVHRHRLPAVLLHVAGLRGLLDELQQPLNAHSAAAGGKTRGINVPSAQPCVRRGPGTAIEPCRNPYPAPRADGELSSARLRTTRPRRPSRHRHPYLGPRRRCLGGGEGESGTTAPNGHNPAHRYLAGGRGREAERCPAPLPCAALSRSARPPPQNFQAARALRCGPAPGADYKSQRAPRRPWWRMSLRLAQEGESRRHLDWAAPSSFAVFGSPNVTFVAVCWECYGTAALRVGRMAVSAL